MFELANKINFVYLALRVRHYNLPIYFHDEITQSLIGTFALLHFPFPRFRFRPQKCTRVSTTLAMSARELRPEGTHELADISLIAVSFPFSREQLCVTPFSPRILSVRQYGRPEDSGSRQRNPRGS